MGRVARGPCDPGAPTDPDVPVKEASGSSSHDFATPPTKPWTTRAGEDCIASPDEGIWATSLVCLGDAETADIARSVALPPEISEGWSRFQGWDR